MNNPVLTAQKLKEMGINTWQVRDFSHFTQQPESEINLPFECKLLFISPFPPTPNELTFFSKVLLSMQLRLEDVFYLPKAAIHKVKTPPLWCWFAGVEPVSDFGIKSLHSCSLHILANDNEAKQQLWRQIKHHAVTSS